MKYVSIVLILLCLFLTACSPQTDIVKDSIPEETASVKSEETADPISVAELNEGCYEITVESNSSMFRVINCELMVEKEAMYAVMTMSGQGYGMLYMGTGEEALEDSEEEYISFLLNEKGEKTFTVPVQALNTETDCAAWSIKKEKWYDRVLVFQSDALPKNAFKTE